jgi:hypothetical protein
MLKAHLKLFSVKIFPGNVPGCLLKRTAFRSSNDSSTSLMHSCAFSFRGDPHKKFSTWPSGLHKLEGENMFPSLVAEKFRVRVFKRLLHVMNAQPRSLLQGGSPLGLGLDKREAKTLLHTLVSEGHREEVFKGLL